MKKNSVVNNVLQVITQDSDTFLACLVLNNLRLIFCIYLLIFIYLWELCLTLKIHFNLNELNYFHNLTCLVKVWVELVIYVYVVKFKKLNDTEQQEHYIHIKPNLGYLILCTCITVRLLRDYYC